MRLVIAISIVCGFSLIVSGVLIGNYHAVDIPVIPHKAITRVQVSPLIKTAVMPSHLIVSPSPFVPYSEHGVRAFVSRVVDGDTIQISTGQKVRYIGIDAPESVDPRKPVQCFGEESSAFNKSLVEGKWVILKKDVSEIDKYGRLLRYVYLRNLFVNDYLVRQGYASATPYSPDLAFQSLFTSAQKEARENGRGLWNACK